MTAAWQSDILGAPFRRITLALGDDPEGRVSATVVRRLPNPAAGLLGPLHDVDVLYVHGWSDYFFQVDLARFWTTLGARFYALDLRKYGRSLRSGQTPGYVASLDDYDDDIAAARAVMKDARGGAHRRLVLMGHSTGGLTLALWAARHRGEAAALVLNSPWLELQIGGIGRQAIAPLVQARARLDPLGKHPVVDYGFYTRALSELGTLPASPEGWKPEHGFPTHPGWLAAVMAGHAKIAGGVDVGCPTLVLLSTRWSPPLAWHESMTSSDSVLVVDDIARAAVRIGRDVTVHRVPDAVHDVFLSRQSARDAAYAGLRQWLVAGALTR